MPKNINCLTNKNKSEPREDMMEGVGGGIINSHMGKGQNVNAEVKNVSLVFDENMEKVLSKWTSMIWAQAKPSGIILKEIQEGPEGCEA